MSEQSRRGSIGRGAFWMVLIPLLLFWIPGAGGLIGGLVGGKAAGGVGRALLAWLMSLVLVTALFVAFTALFGSAAFTGMVVVGFIAGIGAYLLLVLDSGMRLLGAIIGGLLA
jgi:hypothetical protein